MSELLDKVRDSIAKELAVRRAKTSRIVEIRALSKQKLFVRFSDDVQGVYDVAHLLDREQLRELEKKLEGLS